MANSGQNNQLTSSSIDSELVGVFRVKIGKNNPCPQQSRPGAPFSIPLKDPCCLKSQARHTFHPKFSVQVPAGRKLTCALSENVIAKGLIANEQHFYPSENFRQIVFSLYNPLKVPIFLNSGTHFLNLMLSPYYSGIPLVTESSMFDLNSSNSNTHEIEEELSSFPTDDRDQIQLKNPLFKAKETPSKENLALTTETEPFNSCQASDFSTDSLVTSALSVRDQNQCSSTLSKLTRKTNNHNQNNQNSSVFVRIDDAPGFTVLNI